MCYQNTLPSKSKVHAIQNLHAESSLLIGTAVALECEAIPEPVKMKERNKGPA